MKKACKLYRNLFTLMLSIALTSGIFGMNVHAEARVGCSHPQQQIVFGNDDPVNVYHSVRIYNADGSYNRTEVCTITRVYQVKRTICADCGFVTSETKTLISESHSVSH